MIKFLTLCLIILITRLHVHALICSRYPSNVLTPKSPVDENFAISISYNPQTYILGQAYNISLKAFGARRFISFMLALENENGDATHNDDLGHFEISDPIETRYRPNCENMVENTNTNQKTRIDVTWIAPKNSGSGCVLIRATVQDVARSVWYMHDGGLTRRICEEYVDEHETATVDETCCACDEARYELVFDSVWSRNLHPKDFPAKGWITRFSDIVGASHTADYRFWEANTLASEGIKELAEHGSSRLLEKEFNVNFKNGKIRTIIKARGPAFPNLNGQSTASIRVDYKHHFISLASKIEPSPDWIVGVPSIELCMKNCTWLENKVISLYPWDVGTDAGVTYTAADQQQIPPGVISRMRSNFPNDPRSPFFDETGTPMKPMAILTIKRQRLYERSCEDEESNNIAIPRECFTHPWSPWTICTVKCGEGKQYRARVYKQPEVAKFYDCDMLVKRQEERICLGNRCGESEQSYNFDSSKYTTKLDEMESSENDASLAECQLTNWGPWSECNSACGEGRMVRQRQYANPMAEHKCQSVKFFNLNDSKKCFNPVCYGDLSKEAHNSNEEAQPINTYRSNEVGIDESRNMIFNSRTPKYKNQNLYDNYMRESYNNVGRTASRENQDEINENGAYNEDNLEIGNLYKGQEGRYSTMSQNQQYNRNENRRYPEQFRNLNYQNNVNTPCFQALQHFSCPNDDAVSNYWFYDAEDRQCKLFTADSCDENKNKFRTLEACEGTCHKPQQNLEEAMEDNNSWYQGLGQPQSQTIGRRNDARRQRKKIDVYNRNSINSRPYY